MTRNKIKLFLLGIIAAAALCIFGGCDNSYHITVKGDAPITKGKYLDILMPIDNTDEKWCDYTSIAKYRFELEPHDLMKTEISRYDEDGFRSLFFHYELFEYYPPDIPETDSSFDISFADEGEFIRMMEKYKKFRIALFDEKGNVLQVSPTYDARKTRNVYLSDKIDYHLSENTLEYECEYYSTDNFDMILISSELLSLVMPIVSLIMVIAMFISNDSKKMSWLTQKQTFILLIPSISFVSYMMCRLYYFIMDSVVSGKDASIFDEKYEIFTLFTLYSSIPFFIALAFLICLAVRLTSKKQNGTPTDILPDAGNNLMQSQGNNNNNN